MLEAIESPTPLVKGGPLIEFLEGLTLKQKRFADHWLVSQNGVESAKIAGYSGSVASLAAGSSRLLRSANVQTYINKRLRLVAMPADEVLQRLSKQARSSIADVLKDDGEFSLKHAKKQGTDDLIKKLRTKTTKRTDPVTKETVEETTHDLELYSAQSALELMGRHHRLFADLSASETINVNLQRNELTIVLQSTLSNALEVSECIDVTPEE